MHVNQIRLFLAVAQTGSFSAAARREGLSRTTVSAAVAALEDEVGAPLFTRTGNHITLTPLGESVIPDGRRIVESAEVMLSRGAAAMEGREPLLRVARDDSLPETFWRRTVAVLQRQFPTVLLSMTVRSPDGLLAEMHSGSAQIVFGLLETDAVPPGWTAVQLGRLEAVVVTAPDHPLARRRQVTSSELMRHRQIRVSDQVETGGPALSFYEYAGNAAVDGVGWARLPRVLVDEELSAGRLVAIAADPGAGAEEFQRVMPTGLSVGEVNAWLSDRVRRYLSVPSPRPSPRPSPLPSPLPEPRS